jgi:hypothetical protein
MNWININARKPEQTSYGYLSERVVVAVMNNNTGEAFTDMDCYDSAKDRWQKWEALDKFNAYRVTHWMPIAQPEAEKKKRRPYQWGATSWLSSFELNESRNFEGDYVQYRSLQRIARKLNDMYGVVWEFRKEGDLMTITRTQ